MFIEQLYTGCLSQGAYYIESAGEVAIIDPLREIKPYLQKAASRQSVIKYIFETHFHADFVSGHLDLASTTGAPIIYGPGAAPDFKAHIAADGEEFTLGRLTIRVLHTPGHTMESTCYLLLDEEGREHALFTGDTLFIGDVGRPDLAQKSAGISKEELAATLYNSLRTKILPLPDELIIYPGHGAGSACGKNMSKETVSTLGVQKQTNYALRADMEETEFVQELTQGLGLPPAYFPMNVRLNREGYDSLEEVLDRGLVPLDVDDFATAALDKNILVLDTLRHRSLLKHLSPEPFLLGSTVSLPPGWAPCCLQKSLCCL